ncbi:MAG TPA: multicopper oxidase family protein [Ktedonobacteraceae bacterium]|nr:multicopper oxidase family protein [Ktedonobacteraceae bacterium]
MAKTSPDERIQIVKEREILEEEPSPERQRPSIAAVFMIILCVLLLIAVGVFRSGIFQQSPAPANRNANPGILPAPLMPSGKGVPASLNMGMPTGATAITSLQAPVTSAPVKQFTLVAQNAVLTLGSGVRVPAWTFNGVAPGPTLRVQQGDLVVVHVVNHLSFGITIHWHGIDVPNSQDGVSGVTQNAIQPNQTFTYRFLAKDPGTYWYHSHQFSEAETNGGLFGAIIVDPAQPAIHADVDYSVLLHEWNQANNQTIFSMNMSSGTLHEAAQPGQWVRLRLIETSSTTSTIPHLLTLVGAPFKVISLDGHDLTGPQWLNETPVPVGSGQRYDLLFQMPAHSSVSLVAANETDSQQYMRTPAVVIGQGNVPSALPALKSWFDLTTYGEPAHQASGTPTLLSHFDVTADLVLNNQKGTSLGRMGMTYTINGKIFPDTGMIMVHEGDLVRLRLDNQSDLYHPMHLHGHSFVVLARNGEPLAGSSVRLDTVLVPPHTVYDIAFVANNPGIWMLHCHNLFHANWGMDMMVEYYGYTTPYTVGTVSGNFPD